MVEHSMRDGVRVRNRIGFIHEGFPTLNGFVKGDGSEEIGFQGGGVQGGGSELSGGMEVDRLSVFGAGDGEDFFDAVFQKRFS